MKLTESAYRQHDNDFDGYCRDCDDVTRYGMTEPDAEGYRCDECHGHNVCGIANALIAGLLQIVEEV